MVGVAPSQAEVKLASLGEPSEPRGARHKSAKFVQIQLGSTLPLDGAEDAERPSMGFPDLDPALDGNLGTGFCKLFQEPRNSCATYSCTSCTSCTATFSPKRG
jgi:hypothetical protein